MAEFRFYDTRPILCGECGDMVDWQRHEQSWRLYHRAHPDCSRAGKKFYTGRLAIELEEVEDETPPAPTMHYPSNRPPFDTFKGAICRGCYRFNTACGKCEKCAWERSLIGT